MKCSVCGASWDETTVNKTLLACPFCGELLEKKKPKKTRKKKKEKGMKDVLSEVIGLRGETVLEDRDMTVGLMSDLAPKLVKERRQLGMLYDIGAMKSILNGCHQGKAEQQRLCRKTVNQLMDELDMEADAASELAGEVCAAVYGRSMALKTGSEKTPKENVPCGTSVKAAEEKKKVREKSPESASTAVKKQPKKSPASPQPQPQPAVNTASGGNSGSSGQSSPSSSNGKNAAASKPIISNAGTTSSVRGRQKSVLAGASMVKSPQDIQQAALPPKGQRSTSTQSTSSSGTTAGSNGGTATKKKRTRRTTSPSKTGQNTQTAYQRPVSNNVSPQSQSNWTPTPEQLQAYQYYTGKSYPQSAVPQSSGYQPWQPAGGRNSGQSNRNLSSGSRNHPSGNVSNSRRTATNGTQTPSVLQSAMNGDPSAMYQVGLQYLRGSGGMVKDVNEALKWITGAANKGEENAGFMLGYLHYSGTEIPKNESEALRWFLKSVRSSDHEIQCLIGMIYAYGTTVTHNYSEAFKWFYKAGQGGSAQAQFALGEFYHYGFDMEANDREAVNWYEKAARQGHAKARQMADRLRQQGVAPQSTTTSGPNLTASQWTQVSNAVQQAVQQQFNAGNAGQFRQTPQQESPQLPPQTQSWLNNTSRGAVNWQKRSQQNSGDAEDNVTRSPGWRQNQNIGVVSSNRTAASQQSSYQTMPSESRYTLGQGYSSKVNRSVLQEDDDDDWINVSKRRGFADSQT